MEQQDQNFVRELMDIAESVLGDRTVIENLYARWNLNGHSAITTEQLGGIPEFAHLSQSDLANCVTALNTILTALGDNVSGQATNLIKMRN